MGADEALLVELAGERDPSCPWTWITSRWLHEVAPHRALRLRWRALSLTLRDGDQIAAGAPPEIRRFALASGAQSHRLLRVFEALRADSREDDIDRLYTLWGQRVFAPTGPPASPEPHLIGELLDSAGLPPRWAECADDPSWDAAITDTMSAAATATGGSVISPTITLDAQPSMAFTGPIFAPAPSGPAAIRAWDAVSALLAESGFFELSRHRTRPPLSVPDDTATGRAGALAAVRGS